MGIKHKYHSSHDDGPNDGRVQPSQWNDDHDIGDFLAALFSLALTPGTVAYIKADGTAGQFAISDFARALMGSINAPAMLLALGAAPVDSPTFIGLPHAPTAALGVNTTQLATMAALQAMRADLVNSSPGTLDTLKELADALGDDPNFATTMTTALASRLRFDAAQTLTTGQKAQALANLGVVLGTVAQYNVGTGANNIVQLDGSSRLPAVDGSQLTNITPGTGSARYDIAQSLTVAQQSQARANIGDMGRNRVINGRGNVDQLSAGVLYSAASNAYCGDQWRALTESGSLNYTALDVSLWARGGFKISPATANMKFGVFQPIEFLQMQDLIGQTVVLSANLSVANSTRLTNIKMALIQWNGTKDSLATSPVSAWGAAGTNPTLAAGWTYVNTPANLTVPQFTTSLAVNVGGTIGTGMNNLGVLIWCDSKTANASDNLYITDVQLEAGTIPSPFDARAYAQELFLAQQYFRVMGGGIGSWFTGGAAAQCTLTIDYTGMRPQGPQATVTLKPGTVTVADPGIANVAWSAPSIAAFGGGVCFATFILATGGGTQTGSPTAGRPAVGVTDAFLVSKRL